MNTRTLIMPPVGQRVTVTDGVGLPEDAIGATATIVGDCTAHRPYAKIDPPIRQFEGARPNGCEGSWVISGWDIILPNIGDKVVPLPDHDGNWFGLPVEYRNAVGTVSEIASEPDASGRRWIAAEFQSYQKPDDTIRWSFYYWKPADGHTLTVSDTYIPAAGDRVHMTGYLSDTGIIDGLDLEGTVQSVENGIWMVQTPLGDLASGPGYVAKAPEVVEEAPVTPALPHEEPRIITELREEAATLKRELDRANERVNEYSTRAGKWERDFSRYAERIMQEAIDRDWCSEYERIMDEIEGDLEIAEIPKRRNRTRRSVKIRGEVWVETEVWIDEDCDDEDDPDNWYESKDDEDALGSDWCEERLSREYDNNGFDDTEYETR